MMTNAPSAEVIVHKHQYLNDWLRSLSPKGLVMRRPLFLPQPYRNRYSIISYFTFIKQTPLVRVIGSHQAG